MIKYSLNEYIHIIFNYISYKIQKHIDRSIIENKAFNDNVIALGYSIYNVKDKYIYKKNKLSIYVRKNSSDKFVFQQIFMENEYKPIIDYCYNHSIKVNNIIDCGANIGLSTIYFKQFYKDSNICAIEPYEENYKMVVKNIKKNNLSKVEILNGAVWNKKCKLSLNFSFRDGKEWAVNMLENEDKSDVQAYTLTQIMNMYNYDTIDILKMDVEGAEKYILDETNSDVSFLEKTKIIALEIHDEFDCREQICNLLKKFNFQLIESGELTIGLNNNINAK